MTNLTILLACLSMLESNDNDLAVGDNGRSRGRYQITREAWKEVYGTMDFKRLHNLDWANAAARGIITRRSTAFKTLFRRDPTPFELYVLWNAPAQIGKPSKVVAERAKRFANLVELKLKEQSK